MKMVRFIKPLLAAFLIFAIFSCKKSAITVGTATGPGIGSKPSDTSVSTITAPIAINVYPGIANGGSGRVFIKTMLVGNESINVPMLFDTGSAGVTLNALSIFPSSIVDVNGFKFKSGRDTIQYQGITITKINVQKVYGSAGPVETRQLGNVGYARLTVGDASGFVRTSALPILFYYQTLANGQPVTAGLGSVFGVNTANNLAQGLIDTTKNFQFVSPLKYVHYASSVIAGYKLNAVTLNGCDINTTGSCVPQTLLTVGINQLDETNYIIDKLVAFSPQPVLVSPSGYPAYPAYTVYNPTIPNAVISNASKSRRSNVLLDSGTPGIILNFTKDSLNTTLYPNITLTTPAKSSYTYNYNMAGFSTTFNPAAARSVYGIYFFTKFNFLEDYQNGWVGLKAN